MEVPWDQKLACREVSNSTSAGRRCVNEVSSTRASGIRLVKASVMPQAPLALLLIEADRMIELYHNAREAKTGRKQAECQVQAMTQSPAATHQCQRNHRHHDNWRAHDRKYPKPSTAYIEQQSDIRPCAFAGSRGSPNAPSKL